MWKPKKGKQYDYRIISSADQIALVSGLKVLRVGNASVAASAQAAWHDRPSVSSQIPPAISKSSRKRIGRQTQVCSGRVRFNAAAAASGHA